MLAALANVADIPASNPVDTLELPEVPSRNPALLAALVDALAAAPNPLLLVFDDVHELTHRDPLAGLANLIENHPPGLRIVLASRSDPPLRLRRLRLTGELRELRAPELAFTPTEAATVLEQAEVRLTAEQRMVLHAATAGWPAALRLASLTLRDADDPDAFLSDLTGNGQAISDYLVREILSRLPGGVAEVPLAVSVCDAVTAPLAVALTDRDDAADVLADLEQGTSSVASYGAGRRWFRIHPLLRAYLYADLRRRRPDRIAVLHRRTLGSYGAVHNPLGALRHATLADDPTLMRDMLNHHGAVLATSGQHEEVSEVLGVLDTAGLLRGDVELMLLGVLAHMELGRADAADALLTPRARDALRHALAVAEQFGVLRPLVNGPADVIDLPSHELGKLGGVDELGQEVLTTRRTLDQHRPAGSEAPALTVRESAVLDLLPGPLSLDEIAARLAVTTNTVKTHLTAIYAKLGVRSRREAVARGRILVRSTR